MSTTLPTLNIPLNQDNFTIRNISVLSPNSGGNALTTTGYLVSQQYSFTGVSIDHYVQYGPTPIVAPAISNFNNNIVYLTYGSLGNTYTGINGDKLYPSQYVINNYSVLYAPIMQITKANPSAGIYTLRFSRALGSLSINNNPVAPTNIEYGTSYNYSAYAFYRAPINATNPSIPNNLNVTYDSLQNWSNQGTGCGLGFLNIAPQLFIADPNVILTVTINCASMDWNYDAVIDAQVNLNTKIILSVKEFKSMTVVGLNNPLFASYYPALANFLTIASTIYSA